MQCSQFQCSHLRFMCTNTKSLMFTSLHIMPPVFTFPHHVCRYKGLQCSHLHLLCAIAKCAVFTVPVFTSLHHVYKYKIFNVHISAYNNAFRVISTSCVQVQRSPMFTCPPVMCHCKVCSVHGCRVHITTVPVQSTNSAAFTFTLHVCRYQVSSVHISLFLCAGATHTSFTASECTISTVHVQVQIPRCSHSWCSHLTFFYVLVQHMQCSQLQSSHLHCTCAGTNPPAFTFAVSTFAMFASPFFMCWCNACSVHSSRVHNLHCMCAGTNPPAFTFPPPPAQG